MNDTKAPLAGRRLRRVRTVHTTTTTTTTTTRREALGGVTPAQIASTTTVADLSDASQAVAKSQEGAAPTVVVVAEEAANPIQTLRKPLVTSIPRYELREDADLSDLLNHNRVWAEEFKIQHPGLLNELARQQHPQVCWIGCSDSRVPADVVCGLGPGELFVHRNIANVVNHSDFSALSVLQYAVEVLKVKHIVVCGHYGCGGVAAALSHKQYGIIDNWLRSIKDVYASNKKRLVDLLPAQQLDALVELNTAQSVWHVAESSIVQNAWARGQKLTIHGWVYQLEDGLLHDLKLSVNAKDEIDEIYTYATSESVKTLSSRRSQFLPKHRE